MNETFSSLLKFIDILNGAMDGNKLNIYIHIINAVMLFLYFYVRIFRVTKGKTNLSSNKNQKTSQINELLAYSAISITLSSILLVLLHHRLFPIIAIVSAVITPLIDRKFLHIFYDPNDKEINITINNGTTNDEEDDDNDDDEIPDLKDFNKDGNSLLMMQDILNVLMVYGYLSKHQHHRIKDAAIFSSSDEMVNKLLTMPILTEKELMEARVIKNMIVSEGKLISRQKALKAILEREKADKEKSVERRDG